MYYSHNVNVRHIEAASSVNSLEIFIKYSGVRYRSLRGGFSSGVAENGLGRGGGGGHCLYQLPDNNMRLCTNTWNTFRLGDTRIPLGRHSSSSSTMVSTITTGNVSRNVPITFFDDGFRDNRWKCVRKHNFFLTQTQTETEPNQTKPICISSCGLVDKVSAGFCNLSMKIPNRWKDDATCSRKVSNVTEKNRSALSARNRRRNAG